jgi:hypothetical protein
MLLRSEYTEANDSVCVCARASVGEAKSKRMILAKHYLKVLFR